MGSEDLNIGDVKSIDQMLDRTPSGKGAVELAKKLGLWTSRAHGAIIDRPPFQQDLASLEFEKLSRLLGGWSGEYGRIMELCGVLIGQENALKLELRSAQARARSRVRRKRDEAGEKPLSSAALNDEADEDPNVIDLIEKSTFLVVVQASASAARDATAQYLASISREIAFRDAQMKARIY